MVYTHPVPPATYTSTLCIACGTVHSWVFSSLLLSDTHTLSLFTQDGTLTTDELLSAIALDGAVSDDAIDKDVVSVFDKDGDVSEGKGRGGWRAGWGGVAGGCSGVGLWPALRSVGVRHAHALHACGGGSWLAPMAAPSSASGLVSGSENEA